VWTPIHAEYTNSGTLAPAVNVINSAKLAQTRFQHAHPVLLKLFQWGHLAVNVLPDLCRLHKAVFQMGLE
jgi:hypothetical protein